MIFFAKSMYIFNNSLLKIFLDKQFGAFFQILFIEVIIMGIFSMILHIAFMILGVEPVQKFPPALTKEEEEKYFSLHF